MKRIFKLTLCLLGLSVLCSAYARSVTSLDVWDRVDVSSTNFHIKKSNEAQVGEHLLLIDSSAVNVIDALNEGFIEPEAYVIQTVEAGDYIGKHLHVSGFAKSFLPGFDVLENEFAVMLDKKLDDDIDYYRLVDDVQFLEELRAMKREAFAHSLKLSNSNADYGILVLLHNRNNITQEKHIESFYPTSKGENNEGRWNRFNIEAGVPEDCEAISIVLWSRGFNVVGFDHLAVVESGDKLNGLGSDAKSFFHYNLFDYLAKMSEVKYREWVHEELTGLNFE